MYRQTYPRGDAGVNGQPGPVAGRSRAVISGLALNKTTLRAFPIPVPPLAEQRRIVAKVDDLMAVCDELEQSLATERARLLEALLLMRWKIRFQRESMHSLSPFQPQVITQLG
jgi:hypothetical protein